MSTKSKYKIQYSTDDRIIAKYILTTTLTNTSPLVIGSGQSDFADLELVRLPDGEVYIPASTLAGKIRSYFDEADDHFKFFWGTKSEVNNQPSKKQYQSHVNIENAIGIETQKHLAIKDGVKIDYETNTAEKGAKYDYEVLEPGVEFKIQIEVTVRKAFDKVQMLRLTDFIGTILSSDFRIGAFTMAGFGQMKCAPVSIRSFYFDSEGSSDVDTWFDYLTKDTGQGNVEVVENKIILSRDGILNLTANFKIKNALITSTYGTSSHQPDKTQAYRKNNPEELVINGKSIRGALRHRAFKILNTVYKDDKSVNTVINDLFGYVDQNNNNRAKKSRIRIDEAILKGVKKYEQARIKMDRFTSGTIDGALMTTETVWSNADENLTLNIQLYKYQPQEVTLLLLLLKDLWSSDLAIGGEKNIGRGVLEGKSAILKIGDQQVSFKQEADKLNITDEHELLLQYNHLPENL